MSESLVPPWAEPNISLSIITLAFWIASRFHGRYCSVLGLRSNLQGRPPSKGSSRTGVAKEAACTIQTSRRTDMSGRAYGGTPPPVCGWTPRCKHVLRIIGQVHFETSVSDLDEHSKLTACTPCRSFGRKPWLETDVTPINNTRVYLVPI